MLLTMAAEIVALVDSKAVEASNGCSIAAAVLQLVAMLYGASEHFCLRRTIGTGGSSNSYSFLVPKQLMRRSRRDVYVALRIVVNIICNEGHL
jgi:hypothetical protein